MTNIITWDLGEFESGWNVGFSTYNISHLSLEYVQVPIAATKGGVAYNPTGDSLQFAFMPTAVQQPQSSDWVSGIWETVSTNIIYPYYATCLVGPGGSTVLTLGNYTTFIKITDSPEIPVRVVGQLVVS